MRNKSLPRVPRQPDYDVTNSRLDTQNDELSNLVRQKPKIAKNQQVGQVHQVGQKLDMFVKRHYRISVQK